MSYLNHSLKKGILNGINVTLTLAKIIIPVSICVEILKHTAVIQLISDFFQPAMKYFGLPGEASLPIVLGNAINLYAPLGTIKQLGLTYKETTIVGAMLCLSHSLIMESAITKQMGIKIWPIIVFRVLSAALIGIALHIIL